MGKTERPTFAQLLDWLEGNLSEEEAAAIAASVESAGDEVATDVAWIRSFLAASDAVQLDRPPSRLRDVLSRRFEAYAEGKESPGLFRRLVAYLSVDNTDGLAPAGVRSASTEGLQRQLIFSCQLADVALNVQPHAEDEHLDLMGQIFSAADVQLGRMSVQLLREGQEVALTAPNEVGEFAVADLPPGEYRLIVTADRFEVVVESVYLHS